MQRIVNMRQDSQKKSNDFNLKMLLEFLNVQTPDFQLEVSIDKRDETRNIIVSALEYEFSFHFYAFYDVKKLKRMWGMVFENIKTPEKLKGIDNQYFSTIKHSDL